MDAFLVQLGGHLGRQACNLAVRNGISLSCLWGMQQFSRYIKTVDDRALYDELKTLQKLLNDKIKVLSPAIDLIVLKSSRGNVPLEAALPLAKSLHRDITRLGKHLEKAAAAEEIQRHVPKRGALAETRQAELKLIIINVKGLLARIDREIPALQLAISSSGETLSANLPAGVSPSRLMQASNLITLGDTQFANDPTRPVQIGPSFTLSLYMLFVGHSSQGTSSSKQDLMSSKILDGSLRGTSSPEQAGAPYGLGDNDRKPIWQEVVHKARMRLCRIPSGWEFDRDFGNCPGADALPHNKVNDEASESAAAVFGNPNEYSYHLEIVEDLDDGRVHDELNAHSARSFASKALAGIRDCIPVYQIVKMFYTDTGKILNIGNADDGESSPILLLKRDLKAPPPAKGRDAWSDDMSSSPESEQDGHDESDTVNFDEDERIQAALERQLQEESEPFPVLELGSSSPPWGFPKHLDPEWLALEVYKEEEEGGSLDTKDEEEGEEEKGEEEEEEEEEKEEEEEDEEEEEEQYHEISPQESPKSLATLLPKIAHNRSSIDTNLLAQIRNISIRGLSATTTASTTQLPVHDGDSAHVKKSESLVARSYFATITTSLSLLEMLVRLTCLQEAQQVYHLAIPDYILAFFLEETATTGKKGEARWKERNEAKMRVGFDPYSDTPEKSR